MLFVAILGPGRSPEARAFPRLSLNYKKRKEIAISPLSALLPRNNNEDARGTIFRLFPPSFASLFPEANEAAAAAAPLAPRSPLYSLRSLPWALREMEGTYGNGKFAQAECSVIQSVADQGLMPLVSILIGLQIFTR